MISSVVLQRYLLTMPAAMLTMEFAILIGVSSTHHGLMKESLKLSEILLALWQCRSQQPLLNTFLGMHGAGYLLQSLLEYTQASMRAVIHVSQLTIATIYAIPCTEGCVGLFSCLLQLRGFDLR
jgi:hypothetical protein